MTLPDSSHSLGAPLLLSPAVFAKPWGGRLLEGWGKTLPPEQPIGEAWEVSDRAEGSSRVEGGPLDGRSLRELMASDAEGLLGAELLAADPRCRERFPLLFKLLDCRQTLSVQVHPDDARAEAKGDRGKEEAWYVLEAEPDAALYLGFAREVGPEEVRRAAEQGALEPLLRKVPARPGDCFHLVPGTVHAIGGGLLLAEIQQSSDLTYRLYDWGRVGLDGRPRELHLDDALAVSRFTPSEHACQAPEEPIAGGRRRRLIDGAYFSLAAYEVDGELALDGAGPAIVAAIAGELALVGARGEVTLPRGRSALLPAAAGLGRLRGVGRGLVARPSLATR